MAPVGSKLIFANSKIFITYVPLFCTAFVKFYESEVWCTKCILTAIKEGASCKYSFIYYFSLPNINITIYLYINMHIGICIYIYIYIYIYVCVCVYVYMCVYISQMNSSNSKLHLSIFLKLQAFRFQILSVLNEQRYRVFLYFLIGNILNLTCGKGIVF